MSAYRTGDPPVGEASTTLPEDLTRHNILHYLQDNRVATVEQFIEALPPLHKQ